ncbi:PAS domain S-box-containing protein [Sphingomonas zeicaulis]
MILDEQQRLDALAAYRILDTPAEQGFDEIVAFAAALCEVPTALISFVDRDRQWFKARTGLDAAETARSLSFCDHAMRGDELMVVSDARRDPRFADNALVTEGLGIRFYAGAPLRTPEGVPLGALCVIDTQPRDGLTPLQRQGLNVLAAQVMARLALRRQDIEHEAQGQRTERARAESEEKFRLLADTMPQMVWSTLPDGYHDYYNARWYDFTGVAMGSTDGAGWNTMIHPEDQERAWAVWRHSLETGEPYEIEYRLRDRSGAYRWSLGRALAMRDDKGAITRWFGTCTDIHESKQSIEQRDIVAHELSHRIKNIFAVIAGLVSLSARARPEIQPLADDLRERIMALGRAHDFVRPHSEVSRPSLVGSALHGLLEALFSPYRAEDQPRVLIAGANPDVDDRSATPLALLFHELATNAAKYGALSNIAGHVDLSIAEEGDTYRFRWTEHDGPPVVTDGKGSAGFGGRLIALSVEAQLKGTLERRWQSSGLEVEVSVPAASLVRH